MEKLPKAEKGFEVDYTDFTLKEKEEAQLKVGWVPQNGTPLREIIYIKFGKLKTQMLFAGTCKVPPSMIDKTQQQQRRPLRPSSVQNLKKQNEKSSIIKSKLPPNPIVRHPPGSCPPVRPYNMERDVKKSGFLNASETTENVSWSPQPFRMAAASANSVEIKRETFVKLESQQLFIETKENYQKSNADETIEQRRDTFIVPKATAISDESIIRRETFVTSSCPMVTSTPMIKNAVSPGSTPNFLTPGSLNDRRQTYVLPSTVKKPGEDKKDVNLSNEIEKAKKALEVFDILEEEDSRSKELSDIKEEDNSSSSSPSSNVPTDVDQLLQISGIDLDLSPEKKKPGDLSGLDFIADQTMSLPPKSTSNIQLQLSNGDNESRNLSSETFVKGQSINDPRVSF